MATKGNPPDAYPKRIKLGAGTEVTIRRMEPDDQDKILAFAARLPEEDLLFLRTDITDRQMVKQWADNVRHGHTVTLLAEVDGELAAYASVHLEQARWTRRVGEIRINGAQRFRGKGLGKLLTAEIFEVAKELGLKKLSAMMTPDQVAARAAFERLGFRVEAILADWVEDRTGRVRDMLVMTHDLDGFTDQVVARS
ncbi:MAG TPA: GNAT family N-acetyltransferase [Candidatus Binataceae bacterium]|nr:GNAT family N-acetyltransferase [Candidatus Binataceae bacterium]